MGICYLYKRGSGSGGSGGSIDEIIKTASGITITLSDSAQRALHGLKIFGKTTQDGTPTPDAPVPLESVGDGGSVTVSIGISETDKNPQTLTISTPNGLPGIPVTSGGNYTDENGQQWVCDEVDFANGVYVQRLAKLVLDGDETTWTTSNTSVYSYAFLTDAKKRKSDAVFGMCNRISQTASGALSASMVSRINVDMGLEFKKVKDNFGLSECSSAAFNAYLTENPIEIIYELETPVKHDLTAEELAQYAALHTNYPNTTIFNDGGADMEVKYVTIGG